MFHKLPKADEDVFEINPELTVIPEFMALEQSEMIYVMLVADPFSPVSMYRFGRRDRAGNTGEIAIRRHAALHCGFRNGEDLSSVGEKMMHNMVDHIVVAIEIYKEIIRFDDVSVLQGTLSKYRDVLRDFSATSTADVSSSLLRSVNYIVKNDLINETRRQLDEVKDAIISPSKSAKKGDDEEEGKEEGEEKVKIKDWTPD